MSDQQQEKQEFWAIVEVMGHKQLAGYVTEQTFGGASFVRVDSPEVEVPIPRYAQVEGEPTTKILPKFTKLLGAASIYGITPCTEEVARRAVAAFQARPVDTLDLTRPALPAPKAADPSDLTEDELDAALNDESAIEGGF